MFAASWCIVTEVSDDFVLSYKGKMQENGMNLQRNVYIFAQTFQPSDNSMKVGIANRDVFTKYYKSF